MANTFSCTGEKCPIRDGGVRRCTAHNCEDRTPYNADEFFNRKKPTNGDKIRAMKDKELAEFLWSIGQNPGGWNYINGKPIFHTGDGNGWLDWLQQEVDTDDN